MRALFHKTSRRVWDSPTITTWASLLARSLGLLLVTPLALRKFSTEEIAVWYLFLTLIGLQLLVDMGFTPSFSRVLAYAMGGMKKIEDIPAPGSRFESSGAPNWPFIAEIFSTMRTFYSRLAFGAAAALALFGTLALVRPIHQVQHPGQAWAAWVAILAATAVTFRNNLYSAYLQGINQIPVLRRWEAFFSVSSILLATLALALSGSLVLLIVTNQVWAVFGVFWIRRIAKNALSGSFQQSPQARFSPAILAAVWPPAWRSGIGVIMSNGMIQASGIIYAQFGPTASVASYLFSLRLMQAVSAFSQAPFYSKLPLLAQLYAAGKNAELLALARRGMALSYWIYVIGVTGIGLFANPLLTQIRAHARLAEPGLWALLSLAFFVERYGAMHIQLYSICNRIIWHIANGVSGAIYVLVSFLLFKQFGAYAFPIGILAGYLGFYAWYSALHSYRSFRMRFLEYEAQSSLAPFAVLLVVTAFLLFPSFAAALWTHN